MQKNVPELEEIKPKPTCNWQNLVKFDVDLKFSNEDFDIPITNKGTGFKRLLMVAYFEYLALKQSSRNQIFGIEEPETYLHPSLQQDLLDSLETLSEDAQFFLTTHSPIFAGATDVSNIVIVKKEVSLSNYYTLSNEDKVLDIVIEELGIRPDYNLLNDGYRKAVFVEGSNDITFWEIALAKIHGTVPTDILFVPCGGSQVEAFVNMQLCRKINRKFLVVVDSDKGAVDYAAKQAKNNDLKATVENEGEFSICCKSAKLKLLSPASNKAIAPESIQFQFAWHVYHRRL